MAGSGGSHYQIEFDSKSPRKEGGITDLKHCLLGAARLLAPSHLALAPSPIQSSNMGCMRPQIYSKFSGMGVVFGKYSLAIAAAGIGAPPPGRGEETTPGSNGARF